ALPGCRPHSFVHKLRGRRSFPRSGAWPPLCRIYERSAIGQLPPSTAPPALLRIVVQRASRILGWWARGLGQPNPFFDDQTGAPRAVPLVLTSGARNLS